MAFNLNLHSSFFEFTEVKGSVADLNERLHDDSITVYSIEVAHVAWVGDDEPLYTFIIAHNKRKA